ncbi:unnamed protein product [Tenebrio molitor]|nr:unnamed protein product [Tenebrio molitor]
MLRNDTNFNLYITGLIRPNRHSAFWIMKDTTSYPCVHCKGIYTKKYLKRHANSCSLKDANQMISKLNIKEQVFNIMKADEIAFEVKKDLLIAHFGESYMKKHKRERMIYSWSNRMRELSRLLISFRQVTKNENCFPEILHPKNFDNILFATRRIVGYDHQKKTFTAPSLAMHLGTSLKLACDERTTLILKQSTGFQ